MISSNWISGLYFFKVTTTTKENFIRLLKTDTAKINEVKAKHTYIPALGYQQARKSYMIRINWTMPEFKFRNKLIRILPHQAVKYFRIWLLELATKPDMQYILKKGIYCGLDIDPSVLAIAENKLEKLDLLEKVKLELYGGQNIPYESNFFDKVFSCLVFTI